MSEETDDQQVIDGEGQVDASEEQQVDAGEEVGSEAGEQAALAEVEPVEETENHNAWLLELGDSLPTVEATEPDATWHEGRPVQLLPPIGTYHHPRYGRIDITQPMLNEFQANFEAGVRGQQLPIGI